ncbi:TRAP transporter large permease [Chloroflexota bacterium]
MSLEMMSFILAGGLIILLAIGVEVFAAVGIAAAIGLFFLDQPLSQFSHTFFNSLNSFVLTAVPLFIFMGAIFSNTGMVRTLFTAVDKWTGNLPGGTASSVIGVNAVFGAMCGSSVAATAAFGKFAYPEMERLGYSPRLALGALAVGGILSAAIPPSAILIVYGGLADVPVPRLFAGMLLPGIMLALLLILTVVVQVKLKPSLVPKAPKVTWGERLTAIRDLLPWVGTIVLVLGVIFMGIMTPTEAAALGAFLSIVLAMAYRKLSMAVFKESMWTAIRLTSMVAFLIFTANVLGMVFIYMGLTELFSNSLLGLPFGKYGVITAIAFMYIIGGMFINDWALLLLTIPFVLPVIRSLGFSPLWFGVWFVMIGETGLITPPFGMNLFVLQSVVPKHDVLTIARGALPFIIPMLIMAALLVVFPELALWLPNLMFAR